MIPPPPSSTLFPYTTLFRSSIDSISFFLSVARQARIARIASDSTPGGSGSRIEAGVHKYFPRSEEHTSELQSLRHLVCRLLLEKKNKVHAVRTNLFALGNGR